MADLTVCVCVCVLAAGSVRIVGGLRVGVFPSDGRLTGWEGSHVFGYGSSWGGDVTTGVPGGQVRHTQNKKQKTKKKKTASSLIYCLLLQLDHGESVWGASSIWVEGKTGSNWMWLVGHIEIAQHSKPVFVCLFVYFSVRRGCWRRRESIIMSSRSLSSWGTWMVRPALTQWVASNM